MHLAEQEGGLIERVEVLVVGLLEQGLHAAHLGHAADAEAQKDQDHQAETGDDAGFDRKSHEFSFGD
ncbi:hypothetical protein D3C85_1895230 [compost metagenome]